MKNNYYLAIDIGASSGRHIIGYLEDKKIVTKEIYRFNNGVKKENNHLVWDIENLVLEVKKGIDIAIQEYKEIVSLAVDTWGVDYVLLKNDVEVLPVYSYRDDRTEKIINEVHSIIPFSELYKNTGCQFQPFNTIYQLYEDNKNNRLNDVTDFLMIPEYLAYKLTGNKVKEFTNATTTGLISAKTLKFDIEIIEQLGLPKSLFKELSKPKTKVGTYKGINVILCATHDTASAVEGIMMPDEELYISSGTWSLLGVKTNKPITDENSMKANYSNEGGVDYNRYQKNIMGMWVVNELRKELCPEKSFGDIVRESQNSNCNEIVDINDESFLSPVSMKKAFTDKLNNTHLIDSDLFKVAYLSLAESYKKAIEELEKNTNKKYKKLYIVGGGAKNEFLNNLTRQSTKKDVIALPIEATAIGNLKIQMEANNEL